MLCDQCDALVINGVLCHEFECPNAWRGAVRQCAWCGQEFKPENKFQKCCSIECAEAYYS